MPYLRCLFDWARHTCSPPCPLTCFTLNLHPQVIRCIRRTKIVLPRDYHVPILSYYDVYLHAVIILCVTLQTMQMLDIKCDHSSFIGTVILRSQGSCLLVPSLGGERLVGLCGFEDPLSDGERSSVSFSIRLILSLRLDISISFCSSSTAWSSIIASSVGTAFKSISITWIWSLRAVSSCAKALFL